MLTDRNDLKKLLNGEIKATTRSNVVQNEKFSVRLSDGIACCHNCSVDALQVIQQLVAIAKDLNAEPDGNLSEAERSYYDALAQNESAVEVIGNEDLRVIAAELVNSVRESSGVDWWQREDVRAKMRVAGQCVLRRHGYAPDIQNSAIKLIIRQTEVMAQIVSKSSKYLNSSTEGRNPLSYRELSGWVSGQIAPPLPFSPSPSIDLFLCPIRRRWPRIHPDHATL